MRTCLLTFSLAMLALAALPLQGQGQALARRAYLQRAEATGITVCWRANDTEDGWVAYGTNPTNLADTARAQADAKDHAIRLADLQPNTAYHYAYGSGTTVYGGPEGGHYFRTLPPVGATQPVRLWAMGDVGSYNQRQQNVLDAYLAFNNGAHTDGWLLLGDIIYDYEQFQSGSDTLFTSKFFAVYDTLMRNTVCWAAPGNHDYESVDLATASGPYFDAFTPPTQGESGGSPSGSEQYYSADIGNVHIVSINSENWPWYLTGNSPQLDWLRADLAATNQPWKIVYWHVPPYTKGSHDSDLPGGFMVFTRQQFTPIVEQYGVDLVLCGHSHVYERSHLIEGHTGLSFSYSPSQHLVDGRGGNLANGTPYVKDPANPRGTIYAVVGCGGKLSTNDGNLDHPVMAVAQDTVSGSLVIDVHADTLRARFLTERGQVLDDFTIIKGTYSPTSIGQPQPTAPAPWLARLVPTLGRGHQLQLALEGRQPTPLSLSVFDAQGRALGAPMALQASPTPSRQALGHLFAGQPAGLYTLQLVGGGHRQTLRFQLVD